MNETFTREQLIKAQHKYNNMLVDVPEEYAHDKEFFRTEAFADSQISELLSLVE